ncbi:Pkinase-domain-containing protein [Calocera cornea HHB12733]|uniref:non-specific serine/threonine protein kinase n=1 Tax=Calocera cornea HHB12733 TaxID=1353952 RepID=A0A165CYL6_9BASI|nr:Pkinase-domain-containing protein [Calocera cornea HHB12733]
MPAAAPAPVATTGAATTQTTRRPHKTRYEQEEEANGGPIQRRTDVSTYGNWRFGRMIGKGASGRVKLAHHMITQQVACVKIVPKSAMLTSRLSLSAIAEGAEKDERLMMAIEREICIMKLIDHPHLVKLLDVFETDADMYMLLEYVPNGELFDHICLRGRLPVAEALHFFRQIMRGVNYCHRFSIAHRDLKPENLLLDQDMNVKIADFGMATFQRDGGLLETSCGSPHYAAPEIISGRPYHGSGADIWSCGIILHALMTGRLPFDDPNIRILLKKVKEGKFDMPRTIPYEAQDLLRRMIEIDPAKRIKMDDIFKHPFFISANPPMSSLPEVPTPPTRNELSRPIFPKSSSELAIVRGLRALWRNRDEDEILQALFDNEGNWEKVFYWLLCKYQDRLRVLHGGSRANESGSSTQSDNTPTPTKETPNPVSARSSLEVRRLIQETPTPPYRGVTANRVPIVSKTRTPPPAMPLPPVPSVSSRPRTSGKDSRHSFLPIFDDMTAQLSGHGPQSTTPMEVDTPERSHHLSCATTSPMKIDALSGSFYASTVASDSADEREAVVVSRVLDICASSTPKCAAPQLDLSLPHIEEQAALRDELIGLGLQFAIDTTMMTGLVAEQTPPAKPTRAATTRLSNPITPLQPLAPSTFPSTVMGLRIPDVPKNDVAMQEFFRALKLKTEAVQHATALQDSKQAECTQDVTQSPRMGANDSTWVNVSPPPTDINPRTTAPGYRRRSAAPCPQPPQRTKTISVPQAPPTTSVRSPRPAHITFTPDLQSRGEPEYRPSSSHQRRMTVLSYSVQPRNHARPSGDQDCLLSEDRAKARRNTGVGMGYPASQHDSIRRVSEVAMPGAFSGTGAGLVAELQKKRYQTPAGLNLANVHGTAPYMHPAAQHFHPVHQHPYQQPSAFFSPPPSRFGSPPLSVQTAQYPFPASQSPPLPTPVSTTGSESKVNWLASLFRGKGERYQLTSSMGIIDTRSECQRLLRCMEVYTMMEEECAGSGAWTLKCWTTESLTSPWFKAVKFRILFNGAGHTLTPPGSNPLLTPITPSVAASPDPNQNYHGPTVMTFTLEKGASATFRAVFARLRSEWSGTGSLQSPALGAGNGLGLGAFVGNAGYMPIYE